MDVALDTADLAARSFLGEMLASELADYAAWTGLKLGLEGSAAPITPRMASLYGSGRHRLSHWILAETCWAGCSQILAPLQRSGFLLFSWSCSLFTGCALLRLQPATSGNWNLGSWKRGCCDLNAYFKGLFWLSMVFDIL
jgi:hypothetical protein